MADRNATHGVCRQRVAVGARWVRREIRQRTGRKPQVLSDLIGLASEV